MKYRYQLTLKDYAQTFCAHGVMLDDYVKDMLRRGVALTDLKIELVPYEEPLYPPVIIEDERAKSSPR